MEKCYNVKEVAEILGIAERTVRKRIEEKKLEAIKSSKTKTSSYLIPESLLAEFIANNPDLPEIQKFNIEKAKKIINELREGEKEK